MVAMKQSVLFCELQKIRKCRHFAFDSPPVNLHRISLFWSELSSKSIEIFKYSSG